MPASLDACFSPRLLQQNLAVLEILQPELVSRLLSTPLERPDVGLELTSEGFANGWAHHRARPRPLYFSENPREAARTWLETRLTGSPEQVILIGLGLGYELELLLEQLPRDSRVLIWEPDLYFVMYTLSRVDLSEALITQRVSLFVGMSIPKLVAAALPTALVLVQLGVEPMLQFEAQTVRRMLGHPAQALRVEPGQDRPLRIALAHGTLFYEDLAWTWGKRGDEIHVLHTARHTSSELVQELRQLKPDLVMSVDVTQGLDELCVQARVPYVVWEINPRVYVVPSPSSYAAQQTHLFTYRKRNIPFYEREGWQHVSYLPLAANPDWRKPQEVSAADQEKYRATVSFVGNSLVNQDTRDYKLVQETLAGRIQKSEDPQERLRWAQVLRLIREGLELQSRELLQPHFIQRLTDGMQALGLSPLLEVQGERIDLRIVYSRMFGARRRAQALQALAPLGVAVYGDPGWQQVLSEGVYFRGAAEHLEELTTIYNVSYINLDIGRLYQLDIVTMRVFDILAAGGFALVEFSEELPDLLKPGVEVAAWHSFEELQALGLYYVQHPEAREALIQAGRRRVLAEHTFAHRLETIVKTLRQRGTLR